MNNLKKFLIPIACLMILIGFIFACTDSAGIAGPKTIDVEYRFTGTAETVSITYTNQDGGTSMRNNINNGSAIHIGNFPANEFLYFSMQNMTDEGTIQAAIIVDDKVFKVSNSKGGYVIASVSGYYQ